MPRPVRTSGGASASGTPVRAQRGPYGRSRRELAETAIRCFEERGFADTTVGDITTAAGYAERTLFRQFASKEDVVFFDLPDILAPLRALLPRELDVAGAWQAVRSTLIENSVRWEDAGPDLAQRRTRLFHEEPALYRRFLEIAAEWEVVIAEVFTVARGLTEPDAYAQVLAGAITVSCRSALKLWIAHPDVPLVDHTRMTLELIPSGFGLPAD
jgi:AcrR family transcriptional regulator